MNTKLLHIYPQYCEHHEACILGNREGLEALRMVIDEAIATGKSLSGEGPDCIMASDGEGYSVRVICGPDNWEDPLWDAKKNRPFYLQWELEAVAAKEEGGDCTGIGSYLAARGCAPAGRGAPKAEETIRQLRNGGELDTGRVLAD